MKLNKGLFTDTHPKDNVEGTWIDGRNKILSNRYQGVSNEWGFLKLSSAYNSRTDLLPIGVIVVTGTSKFIIFSCVLGADGVSEYSEIGYVDADDNFNYTVVIDSTLDPNNTLAFSPEKQISGEACLSSNGEIISAFTDNNNSPKVINLSDDFSNFDLKQILMFPESNEGNLVATISSGGTLPVGTCFITSRYKYKDNSYTNYGTISEPIYLTSISENEGYNELAGAETNNSSNKSILLEYTNLDTVFKYLCISLIVVEGGVTKCYNVIELPISSSGNLSFLVTGDNLEETSILELTTKLGKYETVKSITNINKQLVLANSKQKKEFKFQKYAGCIELEVKSTLLETISDVSTTAKSKTYNSEKSSLMHDEVYAVYVAPLFNDNTLGFLYTIPGREVDQIQYSSGNVNHTENENQLISVLKADSDYNDLHLESTTGSDDDIIATGNKYFQTRCTAIATDIDKCKTGYWENQNELYPNNDEYNSTVDYDGVTALTGKDLTNGGAGDVKVRHHRMPDIAWLKKNFYNAEDDYGYNKLDTLNLIVKNLIIPAAYLDLIQGFKFFFAKKTPDNSLILCNDITHYMVKDNTNNDFLLNSGGNWRTLDGASANNELYMPTTTSHLERVKCHSIDLINSPNINPTYIKQLLRLVYNKGAYIFATGANTYTGLIDYFDTSLGAGASSYIDEDYRIKKVTFGQYVPNNTTVSIGGKNIQNLNSESFYHFLVNIATYSTNYNALVSPLLTGAVYNGTTKPNITSSVYSTGTILYSLSQYKTDVHLNFDTQTEFISFTTFLNKNYINNASNYTTSGNYITYNDFNLYGGDTILSDNCYTAYGMRWVNDLDSADVSKGVKVMHRFLAPTRNNASFRNITSNVNSNYYPKIIQQEWLRDIARTNNPVIAYNSDYSVRNYFEVVECFNLQKPYNYKNPNRIILGTKRTNLQIFETWKEFLGNEFYELVTSFGEIENIQGLSNGELLIQNQALYKTISRGRIENGINESILGTGDLFQYDPQEISIDKNGLIGTKYMHACKLIPQGYVSIDALKGTITIVGSQVNQITTVESGQHNFFKDWSKVNPDNIKGVIDDCPIVYNGYNIEIDEFFNRLLVSKKAFTLKPIYAVGFYKNTEIPVDPLDWPIYNEDNNLRFTINKASNYYTYELQVYDINEDRYTITYIKPNDLDYFEDNSWTISYSFDYKCWAFFHDYIPNYLFRLRNNVLLSVGYSTSQLENELFLHNNPLNRCIYYNYEIVDLLQVATPYSSYITPVFNDINSFILKSVIWVSYVNEINQKNILENETFDLSLLWNSNQCSGDTDLVVYQSIGNLYTHNIRKSKENWIFNQFKNLVSDSNEAFIEGGENGTEIKSILSNINTNKEYQLKNRIYDKWVAIKLVYYNRLLQDSVTQKEILLTDIDIVKSQLKR